MAFEGRLGNRRPRAQWQAFRDAPARIRLLVVTAVVVSSVTSLVLAVDGAATRGISGRHVVSLALIVGCGVGYEEISRTMGRTRGRLYIGSETTSDMASVWCMCAAIILPLGWSSLVVASLYAWQWRRQWRSNGALLYRKVYSVAYFALGSVAAGAIVAWAHHDPSAATWNDLAVPALVVAGLAYHLVNTTALIIAIRLSGGAVGPVLRRSGPDVLELAIVCLGLLAGVTMLVLPFLVIIVMLPMYLLQRAALVNQLEKAATTDAKTGLFNASTWQHVAEQRLLRAIEQEAPLSVLIIDLDLFKSINDTHGHLAGDQILKAVATTLSQQMRDGDILGRFGGEEFIALVPNTSPVDAFAVAERIRLAVNAMMLSDSLPDVPPELDRALSASVGLSCFPTDGHDLTALVHAADLALYEAKAAGRNRSVLAGHAGT